MTFGAFDTRLFRTEADARFVHVEPIEYAFRATCRVRDLLAVLDKHLGIAAKRSASTDVYFDTPTLALHREGQSLRARTYSSRSFALINVGWITEGRAPWPRKNCAIGQVFPDANHPTVARALAHIEQRGLVEIHRASKESHVYDIGPRTPIDQPACNRLTRFRSPLLHIVSGYSVSVDEIVVGGAPQQTVLEIEFGPERAREAAALATVVRERFGDAIIPVRRNKIDRLIREGEISDPASRAASAPSPRPRSFAAR